MASKTTNNAKLENNAQLEKITDSIVSALGELDRAITPRGSGNVLCAGGHDASGNYVTSLTEAVMGVTAGLCKIADAIDGLSATMRDVATEDAAN